MLIKQNNNILLDEGATIDETSVRNFADDVKCSHGCMVGQLNEDALFYPEQEEFLKKKPTNIVIIRFCEWLRCKNIDIEPLKLKISKLLAEKIRSRNCFWRFRQKIHIFR